MIPKSLPTVTALAALTFHLQTRSDAASQSDTVALDRAVDILGYAGAADVHGLKAKAMATYRKMAERGSVQS